MESRKRAPGASRLRGSSGGHRGAPGPTKKRALPHQEGIDLFADDPRSLHQPPHPPTFHRMAGRPQAGVKLKEERLIDLNLVSLAWRANAEPRYDFVVVDEVQDFTNAELALILETLDTK